MEEILDQSSQFNEENGKQVASIEERMNNLPLFDMGSLFSKAGSIYGKILGPSIGFLLIIFIASYLVNIIPVVNIFGRWLLIMPMFVGYYVYLSKAYHNKPNSFNDMFLGFKNYGNIIVASLLRGLVMFGGYLIFGIWLIVGIVQFAMQGEMNPSMPEDEMILLVFQTFTWPLLFLMFGMFIIFIFVQNTFYFVMLRGVSGSQALSWSFKLGAKKFGALLALNFVLGIINSVGALFLGIGLLFTFPLTEAIYLSFFEEMIGSDPDFVDGLN